MLTSEPDLEVVAEAGNGIDALSQTERTLPHVVVLDVDLPMSQGARTASLLKERAPDCRVLVLSPQEDYLRLIEALDAGASGYLTKEAPLEELIHATRAVHRGETLVPPRMLGPLLTSLLRRKNELDHRQQRISRLTPREREVLALLASGAENETIARTLVISRQTARTHIQNILGKLEVHSRLEAVAFVRGSGMLDELVDLAAEERAELSSVQGG